MSKDISNPAPPELRHLPVKRWQAAMSWWRSLPAPGPSASRTGPSWPFPWAPAHTLTLNRLRCCGRRTTRLQWPLRVSHWVTQPPMAEPTCKYPVCTAAFLTWLASLSAGVQTPVLPPTQSEKTDELWYFSQHEFSDSVITNSCIFLLIAKITVSESTHQNSAFRGLFQRLREQLHK